MCVMLHICQIYRDNLCIELCRHGGWVWFSTEEFVESLHRSCCH